MSRYAEHTSVSAEKSRGEIERTLARYGADGFMYGWQGREAQVAFMLNEWKVKFELTMPPRDSPEFTHTPSRRKRRSSTQIEAEYDKAVRQRWRALALVVKAKLEAVESGITTFEEEFLSHIVMPDGQSAGQWMIPQLKESYERSSMPPLLLSGKQSG